MKHFFHSAYLLLAALRQQARAEKAYPGNFWFEIFSKIAYNLMFLIFLDQLFKRVGSVAGYTYNDFLCMYMVSQLGFYITYYAINNTMIQLVSTINNGNLDLLLLRPVPHRAFLYANSFKPIEIFFTCTPMMIVVGSLIDFSSLHVTPLSIFLALVMCACGVIICNTLMFLLALPAFKTGEATDSLSVFYSISAMSQIPYGKLPAIMKILSVTVLPQLVIAGATTQVLLLKPEASATIALVIGAAVVSLGVSHVAWRYALRQYTSASS